VACKCVVFPDAAHSALVVRCLAFDSYNFDWDHKTRANVILMSSNSSKDRLALKCLKTGLVQIASEFFNFHHRQVFQNIQLKFDGSWRDGVGAAGSIILADQS